MRFPKNQEFVEFRYTCQIVSRFESGPEKNLDSVWTISKNKNEFCPDWIRTRIWILSWQDISREQDLWTD